VNWLGVASELSSSPRHAVPKGRKNIPLIIELDGGKNLTGNPDQFDGKNHGFL